MLLRSLIALASGVLLTAAMPPAGLWPFLFALTPLFVLTARAETSREAFSLGFWFAIGFFVFYILWLPQSFAVILSPFFWVLFPLLLAILGVYWGLVTGGARLIGGRGPAVLWLLPALWVLMAWARTQGYFGFPWGALGYLWLDTPVAQLADTIGVYGLGLLATATAALAAAPFVAPRGGGSGLGGYGAARPGGARRFGALLAAAVLVGGSWGIGWLKLGQRFPEPDRTAILVQGNLDPFGRVGGPGEEVEIQLRLSEAALLGLEASPTYLIWPEGAVLSGLEGSSGVQEQRARETREALRAVAPDSVAIAGARATDGERSFNSVYSLVDGAVVDRYDKRFLVPFGERWPLVETAAPLYRAVFGALGLPLLISTSPGDDLDPLQTPQAPVATYICYESVFPQVPRQMVARGAQLLINVTNDAWFARGDGAAQHFAMGRLRAIETRRWLLRAGIDGITGTVDPHGRVIAALERRTAGTLIAEFAFLDGTTPYVRFGRWIPLAIAVYAVIAGLVAATRRV